MNVDDLLQRLQGVRQSGEGYTALCPSHDDKKTSLSIGEGDDGRVLLTCHAGCRTEDVVAALGLAMKDLMPGTSGEPPRGLTLKELVDVKSLDVGFVESLGCTTVTPEGQQHPEVAIPYHEIDGTVHSRWKRRLSLTGDPKFLWTKGKDKVIPYGLDRLRFAREAGYLLLVEGETDCWTLWQHDIPALGIPGANSVRCLQAGHLKDITEVHIIQEPDDGGKAFVEGIRRRFESWKSWEGHLYAVELEGAKDTNDYYLKHRENFGKAFHAELAGGRELVLDRIEVSKLKAGDFPLTDLGNAERLEHHHGEDLKYSYPLGKWIAWSGNRWDLESPQQVYLKAHDTVRKIAVEAAAQNLRDKEAEAILRHAVSSESASRIDSMVRIARARMTVPYGAMDTNPWLLNVKNGVLDLENGELLPHNKRKYITKLAPVNYNPDADRSIWLEFLDKIMKENQELIDFLQVAVGYSLTGITSEECLFILYGTGRNGKTKFLEAIRMLLGDYAQVVPMSALMKSRGNNATSNDVARMRGARFATSSETNVEDFLNEARVKALTGGDSVAARHLYAEFVEFRPQMKLWLACNHRPTVKSQDEGFWSRVRLIPFTVYIPPHEQDKELLEKLRDGLEGILSWAVDGCLKLQADGSLPEAKGVLAATQEYRTEMDVLGEFIEDRCYVNDAVSVKSTELYAEYREWCEETGERPLNKRILGMKFRERGFMPSRTHGGTRKWKGLALKSVDHEDEIPF